MLYIVYGLFLWVPNANFVSCYLGRGWPVFYIFNPIASRTAFGCSECSRVQEQRLRAVWTIPSTDILEESAGKQWRLLLNSTDRQAISLHGFCDIVWAFIHVYKLNLVPFVNRLNQHLSVALQSSFGENSGIIFCLFVHKNIYYGQAAKAVPVRATAYPNVL